MFILERPGSLSMASHWPILWDITRRYWYSPLRRLPTYLQFSYFLSTSFLSVLVSVLLWCFLDKGPAPVLSPAPLRGVVFRPSWNKRSSLGSNTTPVVLTHLLLWQCFSNEFHFVIPPYEGHGNQLGWTCMQWVLISTLLFTRLATTKKNFF